MPLRLAIDATPLLGRPTGVGQYVRHVLAQLAHDETLEVRAYALTGRGADELHDLLPTGVQAPSLGLPAAVVTRMWAHSDHPRISPWTGKVDVVHGTNFVAAPGAPALVTVHDMTMVRFPEMCTAATLRYPALIQRALDRGALVQTPTQVVADEVIDHFGVDPNRVVAVHHGVPEVGFGADTEPLSYPYLFATGTIEPRKDYPTLLRAFDEVASAEPELRLIIAGSLGWGSDDFVAARSSMRHSSRVLTVDYVSDETRAGLLRNAAAFVYPSLYEGFGLPPLEAMSVGVPVVATGTDVADEVLGNAALTVPVGDATAMAATIASVLSDSTLRADHIARGCERVTRYSWDRCAASIADLYRRIPSS